MAKICSNFLPVMKRLSTPKPKLARRVQVEILWEPVTMKHLPLLDTILEQQIIAFEKLTIIMLIAHFRHVLILRMQLYMKRNHQALS